MLWSQLQLRRYEFLVRESPGHMTIFTIFLSLRGHSRRLYMITSADARPGSVWRPAEVFRDRRGKARFSAVFTQVKQSVYVQWCISRSFVLPTCPQRHRNFIFCPLALVLSKLFLAMTLKFTKDFDNCYSTRSLHLNHPQLLKCNY